MAIRAAVAAASVAFLAVAGCASRTAVVARSSGVSPIASAATSQLCVDPHPATPTPVAPAVPHVGADGAITSTWSLDGGQATVAPPGRAQPRVDRQQALCTLLAADEINGLPVVQDGTGFSLVLGKVTIADGLLATPESGAIEAGAQSPPPLKTFHSRLAWIGVVDSPMRSSCGPDGFASSTPGPTLIPYQLLILDADTAADGLVYAARSYSPCTGSLAGGPEVAALMAIVSVPWRLISRDPGGLFATISLSVTTCDSYGSGANSSRSNVGLVEFDVVRPIDSCGTSKESDQTLRGPTVADRLPTTLTHAALGYDDTLPDSAPDPSVSQAALLCEQAAGVAGVVAATSATTVGDLRSLHAGPPPGIYPFAKAVASADASAPAAWCEIKTASGYSIDAVGPDGTRLSNNMFTFTTFTDLSNGPPALP